MVRALMLALASALRQQRSGDHLRGDRLGVRMRGRADREADREAICSAE